MHFDGRQSDGSTTFAGKRFGPYEVETQIGSGGMGEVYRACDTRLKRPVAIKFLSANLADESGRRRFQQEAQMASALNHPHILTVHDVGEFEGRQYLVSELADGGTLRKWVRDGKRTWRQAVELLTGVADALACAHEAGILHRDIKPDNILITKSGYAKLADFGLAKLAPQTSGDELTAATAPPTETGMIIGTIAYMSPEQASGKPVDARSDIFSFGVVLYEVVAGRKPFQGSTNLETLQTIIYGAPAPLEESNVPPRLAALIEKALEKDPADRYPSARDLVVDLRRLTRQTAAVAEPGRRPAGRKRTITIVAALSLVVSLAILTMLLLRPGRPAAPTTLEYVQLTNFADSVTSPALSPDGRMLAFIRGPETFVGTGEIYVKLLPDGEPVQLTHDGLQKMSPIFSPDGTRIAYTAVATTKDAYNGRFPWDT
jgi:serine/threonine protein kinase